jgi:hypothetical protein
MPEGSRTAARATAARATAAARRARDGGAPDGGTDAGAPDAGPPTTIIVPVLIDTYVNSAMPTVSFGASPTLLVDADPIFYETYVRLDDARLAPGTEIVSATLEVYCYDTGAVVDVHAVTSSWNGTVTWNTRPTTDSTVLTAYTPAAIGLVEIDITTLFQSWVDGAQDHGVALVTTSTDGSDYRSTEHTVPAERPRAVVTYR